jgi:elongation factor Tu
MTTGPFFHMIVDDIFSIRNRGTVVTGKIEQGTLRVGDQLVIRGKNGDKAAVVTGIEAFRKTLDQATSGDTVGILLKDVSREDVQRGDELLAPGSDFTWKP